MKFDDQLDELIEFTQSEGRVCPKPQRWIELWQMLPDRRRVGAGWDPPLPLILAAWWETSDAEKRARLELHLRHAAQHRALDEIAAFLRNLAPDQWTHTGESG